MRRSPFVVVAILAFVVLGACKKSEGPAGKDWSQTALKPYEGVADGIGFTVQVPEGMKATAEEIRTEWEAVDGDEFTSPHVTVSRTFVVPESIDEAVESVMPGEKDVIAKKEALPDGFLVVWHTPKKGLVRAQVYRIAGENALDCRASIANDAGIPNFDGTTAWLEKICLSLTLK
jgi:hypothetical protein